jgi:hypothetical protein
MKDMLEVVRVLVVLIQPEVVAEAELVQLVKLVQMIQAETVVLELHLQ